MKQATWQPVSPLNILIMFTIIMLMLLPALGLAQQKVDERFDRVTCWNWGGSGSAGQGQYIACPPSIVTVVKTEVREVKVPVVVPGPVQRIEVPAPKAAPKIRN
jgi:hypothetical protein